MIDNSPQLNIKTQSKGSRFKGPMKGRLQSEPFPTISNSNQNINFLPRMHQQRQNSESLNLQKTKNSFQKDRPPSSNSQNSLKKNNSLKNIQENKEIQLVQEKLRDIKLDQTKFSQRKIGNVYSYAANTHQGLFRGYNEDRVSIILNISKPLDKICDYWPKCSFFAVYDGHGGAKCADFLRDQLHQIIIQDDCYPAQPKEAIRKQTLNLIKFNSGILKADVQFLKMAETQAEKSGSCAVVIMLIEDILYIANVGDSRAILSANQGQVLLDLTRDHKPYEEQLRITQAGGKIYQVSNNGVPTNFSFAGVQMSAPYRVYPGKLSVSRTIGDMEAKLAKFGGNPNVVIAEPEIEVHKLSDDFDFIILASDGIFDRLSSEEAIQIMWDKIKCSRITEQTQIHSLGAQSIEQLMHESLKRKTLDNITVVMIGFKSLEQYFINMVNSSQYTFSSLKLKEQNIQINNQIQRSSGRMKTDKSEISSVSKQKQEENQNNINKYLQKSYIYQNKYLKNEQNIGSHSRLKTISYDNELKKYYSCVPLKQKKPQKDFQ